MSAPAILIGKQCRLCRKLIPLSIADKLGSEDTGYLCERCLEEHSPKLQELQSEITEFWRKDVYVDMGAAIAPPCAICETIEGDERVLEDLEGKKALICLPCEKKYIRANRDKIRGTKLEWDLKLR